jgi:peptide deformylase
MLAAGLISKTRNTDKGARLGQNAMQGELVKWLSRRQFGDPVLRQKAKRLNQRAIASDKTQKLVADMRHTLSSLELGVGLAAPQVGESLAVVVVTIQPLPHRPIVTPFELVLINPKIVKTFAKPKLLWESCISSGEDRAGLFAKVPRYPKITVQYRDLQGRLHTDTLTGLPAHVVQHEVDHLNGTLFVDRVTDPKTYMTYNEYVKRVIQPKSRIIKQA